MLERWDFTCIVCGHGFANLACVSKEHVIPKSKAFHALAIGIYNGENKAPSHYNCNKLRGTRSFIVAAREIEELERQLSPSHFFEWLNKRIPNRTVPMEALASLRVPQHLELPEHLPGM